MTALRQLGARVSEQLASGRRPVDYSALSDAELYERCSCAKFEDMEPMEQRAILDVRAQVIADPKAWAQAYLQEQEGLDKEVLYGMFTFTHMAAYPTGDLVALGAFDIAASELEEAGILPWYEEGRKSLPATHYSQ